MIPFEEIVKSRQGLLPEVRVLCFDPGETSGWALFEHCDLMAWGQITTKTPLQATQNFQAVIRQCQPQWVVIEDYRVYKNKVQEHANLDLVTPRNIGTIETLCTLHDPLMPITKQMASVAKQFAYDRRLTNWGFNPKQAKHARDAVRHGCYFLTFSKELKEHEHKQPATPTPTQNKGESQP